MSFGCYLTLNDSPKTAAPIDLAVPAFQTDAVAAGDGCEREQEHAGGRYWRYALSPGDRRYLRRSAMAARASTGLRNRICYVRRRAAQLYAAQRSQGRANGGHYCRGRPGHRGTDAPDQSRLADLGTAAAKIRLQGRIADQRFHRPGLCGRYARYR